MAGFFKGLFGKRGKRKAGDETPNSSIYRTSAKKPGKKRSKLVKGRALAPPSGAPIKPSETGPLRQTDSSLNGLAAGPLKQEATGPFVPGEASPLQRVGTGPYRLEANRRTHDRVSMEERAKCVGAAGMERSEHVQDVSEGGLCLKPSSMFQLYAQMEIFLPLVPGGPEGPVLCPVKGVIVWRNQHGMGVKFKDLSEETVLQLRDFIKTQME